MTLEELAVKRLERHHLKLTTAESCSGGLLAGRILNVAGASSIYEEGYITYSNQAKEKLLGVAHATLEQFGAVSRETACEMAVGAANAANADVALSVTGVAGPGGGTKEKPVGLVYIGCALKERVIVKECRFTGTREENRNASVENALQLLLEGLGVAF